MPTVDENIVLWQDPTQWTEGGEQWSGGWGGSEAQWHGTILPRITRFLPTGTILEIAPGHGRWTEYLRRHCERLVLVDLSEECIEACRARFAGDDRISFHVNDGSSLPMLDDASIDFVFSFDSLVHVEADVMRRYVSEFSRVLRPNGAGFVHHSNAGEYRRYFQAPAFLPARVREVLCDVHVIEHAQWRALSMTAASFRQYCEASGLRCISQELVNWSTKRLIDGISTFTPESSTWASPTRVVRNGGFMDEAKAVRRRSPLYGSSSRGDQPAASA